MYVKQLSESEEKARDKRFEKIKELQEKGICFGCYNFKTGDLFPDDGLIIYEDEMVRCQFERYPRATGQTIIVAREHYEDISEMPIELGIHILKISDAIIKLHKEILGAEKVYMCTICDGKRNHLHFQLFPRLKGEPIGYGNFVREEGIIMDYHKTAELYKNKLKGIMLY
ncbi:HIT family protein [Clostridium sp. D2Q-11]|uniref:HIT family protein n=1 Tax=Anaeromonas frigoriresistens TaxID=2683708 RepID=A0A942UTC1_9FIRM|nr:HIT family protein [Anaeromonas frigoriresistens]MBS4538859.1 HIT family protein [Anaeromonas frigoriresistens]